MDGWWAASYVLLWIVVIMLCMLVVALARQIGALHLRLGPRGAFEADDEGPPLGEAPPPMEVRDPLGAAVAIGGPGSPSLLLFVSPGCHVCEQVLPAVDVVARAGALDPLVITDVDEEETALAFARRSFKAPVLSGIDVATSYSVPGTPYVIVLDGSGVVRAKGTVNNLEQMEGLVDTAVRRITEAV
ncbi:MAG TPA: hypothetical protein VNC78_01750 [Actinomycetota bacterium]|nr:hypothetical protein [Actinomycetota bacterium]